MPAPYLVTGVATQDVYPRLEIRELQEKYPKQFTLFILGWEEIRKPSYRPIAAQYEQIAGIHGMPYVPWPGDPDEATQTVRGAWLGYCNHGSIMFPNWHRPCLMLLEQSIAEAAQGIAGGFAKKHPGEAAEWLNAARQLRFPFWDWTDPRTGKEGLPGVLTESHLDLLMPGGDQAKHENILAYYKFNEPIDGFNDRLEYKNIYDARDPQKKPDTIAYFKQWDRTYRWPNSTPVDVVEDIKALNDELKAEGTPFPVGSWANLRSDVAGMFGFPLNIRPELYANVWDEFSNTRFQSSRPDKDDKKVKHSPFVWNCPPIEQPHNNVHLVVGGIGHMCDNDTAAFDPIFYLHHCNVDRLLAFWEHIYPDYVAGTEGYLDIDGFTRNPFTQSYGTFIETDTQPVNGETPLMPFRKSDYTYWTSKDTHSLHHDDDDPTVNKYYTYPPIGDIILDPAVPPTLEERCKQRAFIQDYFGYNPIKILEDANRPPIEQPMFSKVAPFGGGHTVRASGKFLKPVENYRQFIITTSLSQSHFNGSYVLKVFLKINEEEFQVGSIAALGRGKSTGCGNCQARRAAGTRVQGVIIIPHEAIASLLQFHLLHTAEARDEEVIAAIKGNLRPRLVLPSGGVYSEPLHQLSGTSKVEHLPEEAEPSLRLLSCDVYQEAPHHYKDADGGHVDLPFDFHDWKNHDILPIEKWAKYANE